MWGKLPIRNLMSCSHGVVRAEGLTRAVMFHRAQEQNVEHERLLYTIGQPCPLSNRRESLTRQRNCGRSEPLKTDLSARTPLEF